MITCAAIIFLCSAGVGSMYVQRRGADGWLFFVFSQRLPALKGNNLAKSIEYDYTYLESTDSVTILATLKTGFSSKPVSTRINYCGSSYEAPSELIYATPKGKGFVYRIKTTIPFDVWDQMYSCPVPFIISFGFSGAGERLMQCSFGYSAGKWKSNRDKMETIIESVKFNTGKK